MKFDIRGENFEVTTALREYAENKVSKLTKYFNEVPDATAHVKLAVFQGVQKVEVTIPMKGLLLRAENAHMDMYVAIDSVVDKLESQVRKYKTKTKRRTPKEKGVSNFALAHEEGQNEEEYEVVRVKRFALKPMFEEEAIMQMEMLGHNFFVFTNAATEETDVVYRRKDEKYGLISTY